MRGRLQHTPATTLLFTAILIGFGIEILRGAWTDPARLANLGAILPISKLHESGQYWRLLTAMFLHSGILHLALNLIALSQLGSLYEIMFGTRRFVLIYFVAGLAASVTSALHIIGSSVGASGAIFGILGAFVFSVRRSPRWRHDRAARSLVAQCIFWIVANIVIGFRVPQIDNAAHIGGLVTGLLLGAFLPQPEPPPPPPGQMIIDVGTD